MSELFKFIAANTEKQLVISITKKKDDTLIVLLQQDEMQPFSFKGTPAQLDAQFEDLYDKACKKFRALITDALEELQSNVDSVVETEKTKQEQNVKKPAVPPAAKKQEPKKEAEPIDALKEKIKKLNKADAKKVQDITDRMLRANDEDVRKFSEGELKRHMEKLKFTAEEIELWVKDAKSNGKKATAPVSPQTGMFGAEAPAPPEMVQVTEEEAEAAEEEEVAEPEPEPEPVKEEPKKAAPKKAAPKKEEPAPAPLAGPEDDDDLLF